MMEIYEVLNQVHSEEEYMEFPEMETAACIRMEEDVSNYESKLARNDRIDTLEQEISTETEKLLEGLKEEERQILLRYYAEEDDVDVLAKEYGVSSSTIYSKVSRAKKKVRKNHGRLEEHV